MVLVMAGGGVSTNTNGNITSSVSVNEEAGFSIVSYTGNGSNGQAVGHGLSQTPKWIILKAAEMLLKTGEYGIIFISIRWSKHKRL